MEVNLDIQVGVLTKLEKETIVVGKGEGHILEMREEIETRNEVRDSGREGKDWRCFHGEIRSKQEDSGECRESWEFRDAAKGGVQIEEGEITVPRENFGEHSSERRREEREQREQERAKLRKSDKQSEDQRLKRVDEQHGDLQGHLCEYENQDIERDGMEHERVRIVRDKLRDRKERDRSFWDRSGREDRDRGKERERIRRRPDREDRESLKRERIDRIAGHGESSGMEGLHKPRRENEERKLIESDRREKHGDRGRDKESEGEKLEKGKTIWREHDGEMKDVHAELARLVEKERATFVSSHIVQQRKRILRSRVPAQAQAIAREARSRFRSKDSECLLVYRVGEGIPELKQLSKSILESAGLKSVDVNPTIEISVPAELATSCNRQVRASQLWGTDVYTDDSDLVAVLMHTGYYTPAPFCPSSILELRATVRVALPQDIYASSLRNNIRSRAWGAASDCSYSIERCYIVKTGGGNVELEPRLSHTPAVAPTIALVPAERSVTTRAASSSAYRQQQYVQEVTIRYNLCNEPWMKYGLNIVADQGLKKSLFTSSRLKRGDVLYVETQTKRYELAYEDERTGLADAAGAANRLLTQSFVSSKDKGQPVEKGNALLPPDKNVIHGLASGSGDQKNGLDDKTQVHGISSPVRDTADHFRWSVCKLALPMSTVIAEGVPLPLAYVTVLEEGLEWEDVQWSPSGVYVRGKEYLLARAQFMSPKKLESQ